MISSKCLLLRTKRIMAPLGLSLWALKQLDIDPLMSDSLRRKAISSLGYLGALWRRKALTTASLCLFPFRLENHVTQGQRDPVTQPILLR